MSDTDGFDSGFPLYEKLVANGTAGAVGNDSESDRAHVEQSIQLLARFKGHVKKELVHVASIPRYFEALIFVLDTYSFARAFKLVMLAHSSLCYLVKRVVMQRPSFFDSLQIVENITVHLFMLESFEAFDSKNCWLSSVKAFEAIYLLQPSILTDCMLVLFARYEHDDKRLLRFLLVVDELLQMIKKHEKIDGAFDTRLLSKLSDVVSRCHGSQVDVVKVIQEVISKNFKNQEKEVFSQIRDDSVKKLFEIEENAQEPHTFDVNFEIGRIMEDCNIHPRQSENVLTGYPNDLTCDNITSVLENLLVPFQNPKETEQNWRLRQANLTELRKIIRTTFANNNSSQFITLCKELQTFECIGKAVLSLRTTLSMTACEVFKDFLQIFTKELDLGILDQMFSILKNLLTTAKKIASTSALSCLIIMFTNIGFHQKLFHNCLMLINEKSITPRNCSALLLRIFLIEFTDSKVLDNSLIYIEEWLKKGITDAQTSVRESMRLTFWYYYKGYTLNAKNFLLTQFSSQLKKAIELSIPSHLELNYHLNTSARTSTTNPFSIVENSSRNNYHHRKYPSYARPTHSYNASVQRTSNGRSTSEYAPTDIVPNVLNRRKVSAPPPMLTKRSLTTEQYQERSHFSQLTPHIDTSSFEHRHDVENTIQIDLTSDFSGVHSNTLISKYLNNEDQFDGKLMYQNLDSSSPDNIKEGVQTLQKFLLKNNSFTTNESLDLNHLINSIKLIKLRYPQELKPLLSLSSFCESMPLTFVIEIHAINFVDLNEDIMHRLTPTALLEAISELFAHLNSISDDREVENNPELSLYYMKYKQFILNFCFGLLIKVFSLVLNNQQVNSNVIQTLIRKLGALYGQEFDECLYIECFEKMHAHDETSFTSAVQSINSMPTKLKICEELEKKGSIESTEIEQIINRNNSTSSRQLDNDENDNLENNGNGNTENIIVDDRKYLEMTMVNPFGQSRSISGGSVVYHDPSLTSPLEENADAISLNGKSNEEPRVSEITKVVSIYEVARPHESNASTIDLDGDSKMIDNGEGNSVTLSDIFASQRQEHTVKFSDASPKVINAETSHPSSSVKADAFEENMEIGNDMSRKASFERDRSPVTPLTERQSKELSQALNSIEIGKKPEPMNNLEPSNLSAELLVNTMLEAIEGKSIEDNFFGDKLLGSLTYYEITLATKMIDAANVDENLNQMKKAIARIQNRSFTIMHLNCLIGRLIMCSQQQPMREWLEVQKGYETLLQLGRTLLISTDETSLFPLNMASKSIVLIQCLIILNKKLNNVPSLFSPAIKDIWEEILQMVTKLRDYSNEFYLLLQELRDLLSQLNFFNSKSVASILSTLASEAQETGPGIKETFLMETISAILVKSPNVLQKHQPEEIIQMMLLFAESDITEWRHACFTVMANVLQYLRQAFANEKDIEKQFGDLSEVQFRVVCTLASSNYAEDHLHDISTFK
ncbi:hypothetical protein HG535_0A03150 [Zygotorulaspora mrakii]|uniref:Protein STU1 n=1 Tax=Zygotorulaspora mrakii TaxID=42260 RepID=A0A7H9AVL2_ZYGMR|nr:uncharacterized protein HG535_0A03150 [Zygotorulaspora mrakii]QLG70376.1 hypothetical protein HG535_0A03150 [Zygotorulaspora mrakii]